MPTTLQDFEKDGIVIYPVPSKGLVTIQANFASSQKVEIVIYDQTGKIAYRSNSIKKHLDLSYLSNGIYFVKITADDKTITRKIVINK